MESFAGNFLLCFSQKPIENSHMPKRQLYAYAANDSTLGFFSLNNERYDDPRKYNLLVKTILIPVAYRARLVSTSKNCSKTNVKISCLLTLLSLKHIRFRIQFDICLGIIIIQVEIHKISALLFTETVMIGHVVVYTCFAVAISFCHFSDDFCRY